MTATRETPGLPPSRVLFPPVIERYRASNLSAGDTTTTLKFAALASARPAVVFFMRPRRTRTEEEASPPSFAASDTVRHLFSTTDAHNGDVYASASAASNVALGRGVHVHLPPSGANAPFWAFEFNGLSRATTPNNFVDWGYAHYGAFDFEPEIDYAGPAGFGWEENAERRVSWDNSALRMRRKVRRRRWRLIFRAIRWASEQAALNQFLEYAGDGGHFVIGLNKTNLSEDVMLAVLDKAEFSRINRKQIGLELPLLEAF